MITKGPMTIPSVVYHRLTSAQARQTPVTLADLPTKSLPAGLAEMARSLAGKVPTKLDCLLWVQEASGKSVELNPATNEKD